MTEENKHFDKLALYQPWSVAAFIVCVVAVRIAMLYYSDLLLFFDEAQYWAWSKSLDIGYYSKPPMIAWLIGLTTSVCGDAPFCVRLSAPVLHGVAAFAIYFAGGELYNKRTGFWAALIYITLPGVTASSFVISADVPLMLFWTLTFLCFAKALDGDGDKWWILAGICAGLGMLSKYTIAVFFISAAIYMIFHKEHRKYLVSAPFILSALIASFIYFPNFIWNMGNDFVSFSHTGENVVGTKHAIAPLKLLEFFGGQFAVFGPIAFVVLLMTLRKVKHYGKSREGTLLLTFTFTLLAIACLIAATSGAQAHWAAPAYIGGSILIAHYLLTQRKIKWLRIIVGMHIALALLFVVAEPVGKALTGESPFKRLHMWNSLAAPASKALLEHPNTVLVSDERKAITTLMYRLRTPEGEPYPVMKWNPKHNVLDHFDLTTDLNVYLGYSMIFVSRNPDAERLAPYFRAITPLSELVLSGKKFYLFYLQGFKGY